MEKGSSQTEKREGMARLFGRVLLYIRVETCINTV